MISNFKITEFFFLIDDFCIRINQVIDKNAIKTNSSIVRRRKPRLTQSEIIAIMVVFHYSGYRCFKHFYIEYVCKDLTKDFPDLVSYNRFVELKKRCSVPMILFLQMQCLGQCTGISFLDSTTIKVCHYKREKQNKVFKHTAKKAKGTMGWFFGFKLHLVINEKGDIVDFLITKGNVDDRQPLKDKTFHNRVFGKIFADRGYIGKELFEQLFVDGIHLVTKIRKNMINTLMHIYDKIMQGDFEKCMPNRTY